MTRDEQWYRACKEIIDRCVAPDMYGNAMAMLDRARAEAAGTPGTFSPSEFIALEQSLTPEQRSALAERFANDFPTRLPAD